MDETLKRGTPMGEAVARELVQAKMREALERIARGEVPGDPDQPQSMYMNARKMALEALSA